MYAVAGVSGVVGRIVAEQLLFAELPLRLLARPGADLGAWRGREVELVEVDLGDAEAAARALDGVEAALLMAPAPRPGVDPRAAVDALCAGAASAGLPRAVWLSRIGAHDAAADPLGAHGEAAIQVVPSRTVVRAAWRLDAWLAGVDEDTLPVLHAPALRLPAVSAADLGRVAAECVLDEDQPVCIELCGEDDVSAEEVARWLGARRGTAIRARTVTEDALRARLLAAGVRGAALEARLGLAARVAAGIATWQRPLEVQRGYRGWEEALEELIGGPPA
jgi:uncharacterized protein YbjT (DUF2867 family)